MEKNRLSKSNNTASLARNVYTKVYSIDPCCDLLAVLIDKEIANLTFSPSFAHKTGEKNKKILD